MWPIFFVVQLGWSMPQKNLGLWAGQPGGETSIT